MCGEVIVASGFAGSELKFENPSITVTGDGERFLKRKGNERKEINLKELSRLVSEWSGYIFGIISYDFGETLLQGVKRNASAFERLPPAALFFFHAPEEIPELQEVPHIGILEKHFYPSDEKFLSMVREAIRKMEEGEMYVINLSRVLILKFNLPLPSWEKFYLLLQKRHPAEYSFYMKYGKTCIVCNSPELFLKKEGRRIWSEPIKGTLSTAVEKGEELLKNNPKERAENIMVVDMMRNDLNRISIPGSVRVPVLFEVKRLNTIYQMYSRVEGMLLPEIDFFDILKNTFPPASVTGAPKNQVVKNLAVLEPFRRKIYCGSAFLIKPNKDFVMNVLIRVLVIRGRRGFYFTGAGITVDSDPLAEIEETKLKALNLLSLF